MESLVPFVLGLIVTAGVLAPVLLRSRSAAADSGQRAEALRKRLDAQLQARTQLEGDLRFLTSFLTSFPQLSRGLYGGVKERKVPQVVLEMVTRSLKPKRAVVLVRRKSQDPAEDPSPSLVVAAVSPPDSPIAIGSEFPLDRGEIGLVAEAQTAMNRADLSSEEVASRLEPDADVPSLDLVVEVMAPMVFDQETLGIIALEGVERESPHIKAALQLIAQTGAQALNVAAAYGRMKVSAQIDDLTGIFKRSHLNHLLSELIYTAACAAYDERGTGASGPRKLSTVSIFMFDIDHFKNYNEVNGPVAGDTLLQRLAELVQTSIRSDDILGRFGGDEFLLILPHATLDQAMLAAEKVRRVIAAQAFPNAASQPLGMVTISGGAAEYPFDGLDAASLVKTVDDCLKESKRKGRNQVTAPARHATGKEPPGAGDAGWAGPPRGAGEGA